MKLDSHRSQAQSATDIHRWRNQIHKKEEIAAPEQSDDDSVVCEVVRNAECDGRATALATRSVQGMRRGDATGGGKQTLAAERRMAWRAQATRGGPRGLKRTAVARALRRRGRGRRGRTPAGGGGDGAAASGGAAWAVVLRGCGVGQEDEPIPVCDRGRWMRVAWMTMIRVPAGFGTVLGRGLRGRYFLSAGVVTCRRIPNQGELFLYLEDRTYRTLKRNAALDDTFDESMTL